MNTTVDLCLLCLRNNENLKSIISQDSAGTAIELKCRYVLNERVNIKPEVSYHMCSDCLKYLDDAYKFKQMSIQNINKLNQYVDTLRTLHGPNKHLNVTITDIKRLKEIESSCGNESPNEIFPTVEEVVVKEERVSEEEDAMQDVKKETEIEVIHEEIHLKNEQLFEATYSDSEDNSNDTLQNEEANTSATNVASSLFPEKSAGRYEREYVTFKNWQKKSCTFDVTQDALLAYFNQLSEKVSPNTLWSKWSMLKSCLELKESIDVRRFHKIHAFLRRGSKHYIPKKAKVLTKQQVEKFLVEASDDQWLLFKIITIFGIFGACRCDELLSLTLNDVEDIDKYIVVTLRSTKNFTTRRFTITDDDCSFQPCVLYRKYAALRPPNTESLRLFLTYRSGKCIALNAGQHTIGCVPKKIAEYLGLEEAELFTGHSFRRTAATMSVDTSGDNFPSKRPGGWQSSTIIKKINDQKHFSST